MPPNFSREWEELFLQTKFLAVGSSLGHLSMKKFSDQTYCLGSKIRQREGTGSGNGGCHGLFLTYFSNHEDDIQSQQILVWNKIVQGEFVNKNS